jgi:hypothetical protein
MVPVYVVERVLGAEITTADENINIIKNDQTMTLTLNSDKASFNGADVNLPLAPRRENGEVMVPLRAVMDAFGARVDWQADTRTVMVGYQEERQGMDAEGIIAKSNEAMAKFNSYKTKVDMKQQMEAANPEKAGQKEKMEMNMNMEMAVQNKPVLVYGKIRTVMDLPGQSITGAIGNSEILLNEQGMYVTMPEQGWVKMTIPGMDIKALMEQSGNQDPLNSIKQLKDAGVILSFASDQQKEGQSYWVINVTMGADSVSRLTQDVLKQVPLPQGESSEINQAIEQVFKNMQADIVYNIWINQESFLSDYMELDSDVKINMQLPSEATEKDEPVTMDMAMQQSAFYEMYDWDVPFEVPDVSGAVDMSELIPQQQ